MKAGFEMQYCHFEDNEELVKSEHFSKSRRIIVG